MQVQHASTTPTAAIKQRIQGKLTLCKQDMSRGRPSIRNNQRILPPQEYSRMLHPDTGCDSFGRVPKLERFPSILENLPVTLTYGRAGSLGAEHIWYGHRDDVEAFGGKAAEDAGLFVAEILRQGAELFPAKEERPKKDRIKIIAHRPRVGSVILSLNTRVQHQGWRVVTAYRNARTYKNSIGQLKVDP